MKLGAGRGLRRGCWEQGPLGSKPCSKREARRRGGLPAQERYAAAAAVLHPHGWQSSGGSGARAGGAAPQLRPGPGPGTGQAQARHRRDVQDGPRPRHTHAAGAQQLVRHVIEALQVGAAWSLLQVAPRLGLVPLALQEGVGLRPQEVPEEVRGRGRAWMQREGSVADARMGRELLGMRGCGVLVRSGAGLPRRAAPGPQPLGPHPPASTFPWRRRGPGWSSTSSARSRLGPGHARGAAGRCPCAPAGWCSGWGQAPGWPRPGPAGGGGGRWRASVAKGWRLAAGCGAGSRT